MLLGVGAWPHLLWCCQWPKLRHGKVIHGAGVQVSGTCHTAYVLVGGVPWWLGAWGQGTIAAWARGMMGYCGSASGPETQGNSSNSSLEDGRCYGGLGPREQGQQHVLGEQMQLKL